jgi:hypothetical protein
VLAESANEINGGGWRRGELRWLPQLRFGVGDKYRRRGQLIVGDNACAQQNLLTTQDRIRLPYVRVTPQREKRICFIARPAEARAAPAYIER